MNKFLIAVFNSESQAYEGRKTLTQLDDNGDITVFAAALVAKDHKGNISVKQAADEGPVGTATGLLIGAMSGLVALAAGTAIAPVAALAGGASIGGFSGMFADLYRSGADLDFIDEVSRHLEPGMSAIIADVAEAWTTPVNNELEKYGAKIFRQSHTEIIEDQFLRELDTTQSELKALEEEFAKAQLDSKDAIGTQINNAKRKVEKTKKSATQQLANIKGEIEAKMAELQKRATHASEKNKQIYDQQVANLRKSLDSRSKKLRQALDLAKDAFLNTQS